MPPGGTKRRKPDAETATTSPPGVTSRPSIEPPGYCLTPTAPGGPPGVAMRDGKPIPEKRGPGRPKKQESESESESE